MSKLFPGVTDVAARRLAAIGGSFHHLTQHQQEQLVETLRADRLRGPKVKAIKKEKTDNGESIEGSAGTERESEEGVEDA